MGEGRAIRRLQCTPPSSRSGPAAIGLLPLLAKLGTAVPYSKKTRDGELFPECVYACTIKCTTCHRRTLAALHAVSYHESSAQHRQQLIIVVIVVALLRVLHMVLQ